MATLDPKPITIESQPSKSSANLWIRGAATVATVASVAWGRVDIVSLGLVATLVSFIVDVSAIAKWLSSIPWSSSDRSKRSARGRWSGLWVCAETPDAPETAVLKAVLVADGQEVNGHLYLHHQHDPLQELRVKGWPEDASIKANLFNGGEHRPVATVIFRIAEDNADRITMLTCRKLSSGFPAHAILRRTWT